MRKDKSERGGVDANQPKGCFVEGEDKFVCFFAHPFRTEGKANTSKPDCARNDGADQKNEPDKKSDQAFQDGVAFGVPQAVTIAAANDAVPVTLTLGPRVPCNGSSIITLVATTTAGNVIIGSVSTLAWKL